MMQTVFLNKNNEDLWDRFCLEFNEAWFWHTTDWMNYVLQYRPDFNPCQFSFLVENDNRYVAICPLILETHNNRKEFSFSEFGIPTPALANGLSSKLRKKIHDFIFEYIDQAAHSMGVQKVSFRFSPLAPSFIQANYPLPNYLMRYGYLDATFNTQVLDITPSIEELKTNTRKGHKYDINRTSRILDVDVFDKNTITREAYNLYCELHHKDAGRVTRPQITFDLMFNWINGGKAILVGAKLKEKKDYAGFAYLFIYKNGAYYGSACSNPDLNEIPIAHFILWESMKWLKRINIRYFELGWQFYGPTFHNNVSEKDFSISKFKRGFGGEQLPQLIAEKYYDSEYFKRDYMLKIENYVEYLKKLNNIGAKK
jgi:hypothetical protein